MKLILLLLVFLHQNVFTNAEIDCSIYRTDLQIINLNPFYVGLSVSSVLTSADYDRSTGKVQSFRIYNDVNPSSNIYCLKNLQLIDLLNTNLTILPNIKNFQNLKSLAIRTDNGMIDQHLPSEIGQLKSLSTLNLFDIKNLEDLPDDIEYLTQLTSLNLQKIPNFKKLPDESIGKLTQLSTLNLIDLPNLSNLPSTMNNFQLLKQLVLTNLNIINLQLDNLNKLSSLDITLNSKLNTIEITNMPLLSSINIQNNSELITLKLENLPSVKSFKSSSSAKLEILLINNLSQLISVEISSFPLLKHISFINTPLIVNLTLSKCNLTTFPQSILTLKTLEMLSLSFNQLSSLPLTLATDLPNLKLLNLANNKFEGNIILPPLINLLELYLTNNALTSFNGIENYKSLQTLDLENNRIPFIPIEIMELSSSLKTLNMNWNKLNTIPYQLANMRSLTKLLAAYNNISLIEKQNLSRMLQRSSIVVLQLF